MDEESHMVEAKILWNGDKSWLIETTIPIEGHYKFFLPKSKNVTINHYETNGEGNWMFEVADWFYNKKWMAGEFWADEDR